MHGPRVAVGPELVVRHGCGARAGCGVRHGCGARAGCGVRDGCGARAGCGVVRAWGQGCMVVSR